MLESIKNKAQRGSLIKLLEFIVESTKQHGMCYAPKKEVEALYKAEPSFLEIDVNNTNAQNQVKAVALQAAIEALEASKIEKSQAEEVAPLKSAPMKFEMITLTEIPDIMRGGKKSEFYPFDDLRPFPEPNNTFFVPATEEKPNPAKALASTVASANKRYSKKDQRVFTLRKAYDKNDKTKVIGAYVMRTA